MVRGCIAVLQSGGQAECMEYGQRLYCSSTVWWTGRVHGIWSEAVLQFYSLVDRQSVWNMVRGCIAVLPSGGQAECMESGERLYCSSTVWWTGRVHGIWSEAVLQFDSLVDPVTKQSTWLLTSPSTDEAVASIPGLRSITPRSPSTAVFTPWFWRLQCRAKKGPTQGMLIPVLDPSIETGTLRKYFHLPTSLPSSAKNKLVLAHV